MPRLAITCPNQSDRIQTLDADQISIGRGKDNDLPLQDDKLSRRHCRLERQADGYQLNDLGSANGTRLNGHRVTEPTLLQTGDVISLGNSRLLFVAEVTMTDENGAANKTDVLLPLPADVDAASMSTATASEFGLQYIKGNRQQVLHLGQDELTIGRHKSCGLVLADSSVSSCHARVEYRNGEYWVVDLNSTNGIRVNGKPTGEAQLKPGTRMRIGIFRVSFKALAKRSRTTMAGGTAKWEDEPESSA